MFRAITLILCFTTFAFAQELTEDIQWAATNDGKLLTVFIGLDDGDEKEIPAPDNDLALKAIARLEHQIEIEGKILQVPADPNSPTNTHLLSDEQLAEIIAKKKP